MTRDVTLFFGLSEASLLEGLAFVCTTTTVVPVRADDQPSLRATTIVLKRSRRRNIQGISSSDLVKPTVWQFKWQIEEKLWPLSTPFIAFVKKPCQAVLRLWKMQAPQLLNLHHRLSPN
ncbi:hypothetical protein SISNIDRAFT_467713 [Sistotremastrum niveocremeum HHB9708]|uniref:Uncharacterized protein n=1 Tax=Sistotremastrum niveocremeum HHB9708 TaxID=1314777 RepID=A0A164SH09_9AGAM|nr:hypothetical protein SISNIDRAFT_467713 [Sistotremastrum niveocremeum HHB9708]